MGWDLIMFGNAIHNQKKKLYVAINPNKFLFLLFENFIIIIFSCMPTHDFFFFSLKASFWKWKTEAAVKNIRSFGWKLEEDEHRIGKIKNCDMGTSRISRRVSKYRCDYFQDAYDLSTNLLYKKIKIKIKMKHSDGKMGRKCVSAHGWRCPCALAHGLILRPWPFFFFV